VLRRFTTLSACFIALALVLVGCGGGGGGDATIGDRAPSRSGPSATAKPLVDYSYIATVKPKVKKIGVFDSPDAESPSREFENPWLYDPEAPASEVPQVFLVKDQRTDGWVQVLLPVRPNGSTGWVKSADVTLIPNPYRIDVSLGAHTITVKQGGKVIYTGPVAVGATDPPLADVGKPTPTPTGEYYLRVLLKAPDPNTVYGPYAYGLSSHSETLDSFAGSDAEVGIHGNNDASVLGQNVSNGCVRVSFDDLWRLRDLAPVGTPVEIVA